jgi:hypothetical protein
MAFCFQTGARNVSHFPKGADRLWELTSRIIQRRTGTLSHGVKWPWREAYHSRLFSDNAQNGWSYTSLSPYVFMACILTTLPLSCTVLYFNDEPFLWSAIVA